MIDERHELALKEFAYVEMMGAISWFFSARLLWESYRDVVNNERRFKKVVLQYKWHLPYKRMKTSLTIYKRMLKHGLTEQDVWGCPFDTANLVIRAVDREWITISDARAIFEYRRKFYACRHPLGMNIFRPFFREDLNTLIKLSLQ